MTIEQDYMKQIEQIDEQINNLRKQRQTLFIEYMRYLSRQKDSQTDLCDYIKEQELKKEN
jgi:hypothetical protein